MTREEDNICITDCTTDTKADLDANHYPLMATLKVKFRKLKPTPKATPKYDDKNVWKNPQKLNETIMGLIKSGGLRNHGS